MINKIVNVFAEGRSFSEIFGVKVNEDFVYSKILEELARIGEFVGLDDNSEYYIFKLKKGCLKISKRNTNKYKIEVMSKDPEYANILFNRIANIIYIEKSKK